MKKLLFIIFAICLLASHGFAANARTGNKGTPDNTLNYEKIVVDTDPGASGYATLPMSVGELPDEFDELWFSIEAITGATVTLQWANCSDNACTGATWVDYEEYTEVTAKVIHDPTKSWRVIIKDDAQGTTSTSMIMWRKKR